MINVNTRKILKGELAKAKWKEGKEIWNSWVAQNPEADIDLSFVHFSDEDKVEWRDKSGNIKKGFNFEGFNFPNGNITFHRAVFFVGDVSFANAVFGNGYLDFTHVIFNTGTKNFSKVDFGKGTVDFSNSEFGEGLTIFSKSKFLDGNVIFYNTSFGKGDIHFESVSFNVYNLLFQYASFNDGHVSFRKSDFFTASVDFQNSSFGVGNVDFSELKFSERISFEYTDFGKGSVSFAGVEFEGPNIDFLSAKVDEGFITFDNAKFSDWNVRFERAIFKCNASFENITIHPNCNSFSFKDAKFDGSFRLSFTEEVTLIPDLVGTKVNHQVDLHKLKCRPKGVRKKINSNEKVNENDLPKLTRLKELAESSKDHDTALRFHADEIRIKRKWWNLISYFFDISSNYGQEIFRPILCLIITIIILISLTYVAITCDYKKSDFLSVDFLYNDNWSCYHELERYEVRDKAVILALSKAIPFIGNIGTDSRAVEKKLELPDWYKLISYFFSILSYVFIFLIGLCLRNRYRI